MGTRAGDIDPALPGFLARKEGIEPGEVEAWLNTRSGLLGVSERSSDMRQLLEAEAQGEARAALAVDMFCYRVRKYLMRAQRALQPTLSLIACPLANYGKVWATTGHCF